MDKFLAKMEEKANTSIKKIGNINPIAGMERIASIGGLRTSKNDNISDFELSRMTLAKKTPQVSLLQPLISQAF